MQDKHTLAQIFLNILINAEQAILDAGKGGRITITTRLRQPEEIMISFRDTGSGISREQLSKIFDPFSTTKEVGRGTGLGLSLSYGIIRQHGGSIRAESQPGKGSEFLLTLPVSPA